jgi:hypothetical protein
VPETLCEPYAPLAIPHPPDHHLVGNKLLGNWLSWIAAKMNC